MSEKIYEMRHNDKTITVMDARNLFGKDIQKINNEFMEFISGREKDHSLRIFIDGRNCVIDTDAFEANREWNAQVTPYTKKLALIGMYGFKRVMFNAISYRSPIEMKALRSKEEALEWLTSD